MTYPVNHYPQTLAGENRSLAVGEGSESMLLCQGRTDTLARIRKAVARMRRQKKIDKLASDTTHWKGLS